MSTALPVSERLILVKPPLRVPRALAHRLFRAPTARLRGVRLVTDPAIVPRTVRYGIFRGTYEQAEAELVARVLSPGDRVVDIGCGTGFVSLLAAKIAGEGRVFSYEANASLEALIRRNHALNGIVPELTMRAVTVDGAPVRFHRSDNLVSSSLYDRDAGATKVEIASVALSDVLAARTPDVVLMDVEGAEVDLLPGADLGGVRAIVLELHPHIVGAAPVEALLAAMAGAGFTRQTHLAKNVLLERAA